MILHVTWVAYLHFLLLTIIEPSELIFETYRRSRSEMFFKIGVLKSFAKFTGKTLGPSLFLTLFKKRYWHRCFPVNFATFLRIIPFLYRTPPVAASWRIHDSRKSLRKGALQEALLFTFAWVWILLGLVLINWRKSNQEMEHAKNFLLFENDQRFNNEGDWFMNHLCGYFQTAISCFF